MKYTWTRYESAPTDSWLRRQLGEYTDLFSCEDKENGRWLAIVYRKKDGLWRLKINHDSVKSWRLEKTVAKHEDPEELMGQATVLLKLGVGGGGRD